MAAAARDDELRQLRIRRDALQRQIKELVDGGGSQKVPGLRRELARVTARMNKLIEGK